MLILAKISIYLGLLFTLGSGLLLLIKPRLLESMGLTASTPAAMSELRALGGMLIGLAVAAFLSGTAIVYSLMAAGWGGVTVARFISIPVDRASLRTIGSSIVVDLFATVCFLIGAIYLK